ncbi:MAG: TetR/AcrR family transcriptional regulator [Raoultibacter sp.]
MARPRKDEHTPDACQRLSDAFWDLLETHQLNEITVGLLSSTAGVNRGTFYYHFDDINDMIDKLLKKEMFKNNFLPNMIFNMMTGVEQNLEKLAQEFFGEYFVKMGLLFDRGGYALVSGKVKKIVFELWTVILLEEKQDMKLSTRMILEHSISGVLGMITFAMQQDDPKKVMMESEPFRISLADFLLGHIAQEENLTKEEVLSRILMTARFNLAAQ